MAKQIISFEHVQRRELPSIERKGATAQIVDGTLAIVVFHDSKSDIESLSGVALEASQELRGCRSGVPDTLVLVCLGKDGRARLLDVLMSKGVNVRDETWRNRHEELIRLRASMTEQAKDLFPIAVLHKQGFLKLYDQSSDGLILRVTGKRKPLRCQEVG